MVNIGDPPWAAAALFASQEVDWPSQICLAQQALSSVGLTK